MLSCLKPKVVYNKYLRQYISAPCGKCDACKSIKANEWCNRCRLESMSSRYCMFVTLTYAESCRPIIDLRNDYDMFADLDNFKQLLSLSSEYVSLRDGKIPVVSVRDIQTFVKRLRSYINRDLIFDKNETDKSIRYFVASEYGPTSFHPHYHCLFWFNSTTIFKEFKKLVYKAWFPKNPHKTLSSFLKRNRISRVRFGAERYVASYLNCSTNLPPILTVSPFRTWHLCSKATPLGYSYLQPKQIQELLSGDVVRIGVVTSSSSGTKQLSLWRSLEDRFFPRPSGFSRVSFYERRALYFISTLPYGRSTSYPAFEEWFLLKWNSLLPLHVLLRFLSGISDITSAENRKRACNYLRRLWYVSKRYLLLCLEFGLSPHEYLNVIDRYFANKNYGALKMQLDYQVYLSESHFKEDVLAFYPYVIDNLFAENYRKLPTSTRLLYYNQFGIKQDMDFCASLIYGERSALFHKIRAENTKVRIHKDFVANHPEFMRIYTQNMFSTFCLT